ncbi:DNA-directed RNA polymerase III subunit RPC10 [Aspergillus bombycis]|uniref:DNA-directed RNA polymerase III subunit RPC10 n=1 Tax=Aspergillus bombycis TaxID=109264 RepID=A0A1F8A9H6_9EURO|nr:DNA-directed RNA polymerase III subunit RPC10 [Aspergillus bombycis]OGM48386.1 DNA-directed RNA polymerase III subunit RPC10 [Aspergillus bombycis]
MKQKEVEDVFGGKEEFANADSMATQCPAENCNGDRAYFFQLQIRSADEPMTTFLKVGGFPSSCGRLAYSAHTDSVVNSVPAAVPDGEKTEASFSGVQEREMSYSIFVW